MSGGYTGACSTDVFRQTVAAAGASFLSVVFLTPFDVVKVRSAISQGLLTSSCILDTHASSSSFAAINHYDTACCSVRADVPVLVVYHRVGFVDALGWLDVQTCATRPLVK